MSTPPDPSTANETAPPFCAVPMPDTIPMWRPSRPWRWNENAVSIPPSEAGTFRFDMGPTFFLYPRVLADIFAACGLLAGKHKEEAGI